MWEFLLTGLNVIAIYASFGGIVAFSLWMDRDRCPTPTPHPDRSHR